MYSLKKALEAETCSKLKLNFTLNLVTSLCVRVIPDVYKSVKNFKGVIYKIYDKYVRISVITYEKKVV